MSAFPRIGIPTRLQGNQALERQLNFLCEIAAAEY
jgi:hypothetical protein